MYQNYYTVTVNKYLQPKELSVRCQCPYNLGEICRHEVAALFQLNDILQSGFFENSNISYDQKHTVVRMRQVTKQMMQIFTSSESLDKAEKLVSGSKVVPDVSRTDRITAEVTDDGRVYHVAVKQNEERYFDTSCDCDEHSHPLCVHKAAVFLQILKSFGAQFFLSLQNWDMQKNKLLEQYGYSLKDDLTNKFAFTYENNKPFLRVLDPSIKKVNEKPREQPVKEEQVTMTAVMTATQEKRLGIVLDMSTPVFPYTDVALIAGNADEDGQKLTGSIEKLELAQYINPMRYPADDREILPVARKFMTEELLKFLKKNLPFGDLIHDYDTILKDLPQDEIREQAWEYLLPKYQKLLERYSAYPFVYIKKPGKSFSSAGLEQVAFMSRPAHPQLIVRKEKNEYTVTLEWIIDSKAVAYKDVEMLNAGLLLHESNVYAAANLQELQLIEVFLSDGKMNHTC
ncbi:MAG: SWIM zinc finger family protein [Luteolibacter sp.]